MGIISLLTSLGPIYCLNCVLPVVWGNRTANVLYHNIEGRSCNYCYRGKAINITYSECVSVALGIQHAKRMRRIVICGVSGSNIRFHIISLTARFSGKNLLCTKCVFWFSLQLLSDTFLIPRRIRRDIIINVHRSSCNLHVILVRF
jgi:hypothetical protein